MYKRAIYKTNYGASSSFSDTLLINEKKAVVLRKLMPFIYSKYLPDDEVLGTFYAFDGAVASPVLNNPTKRINIFPNINKSIASATNIRVVFDGKILHEKIHFFLKNNNIVAVNSLRQATVFLNYSIEDE